MKWLIPLLFISTLYSLKAGQPRDERWRWSNPAPHGNNVLDLKVVLEAGVQVGDSGSIHILQSDGRWAPVNTSRKSYLRSAAYLDDRLIVTGESGLILWSDDGANFQTSELSPANDLDWFEGVCASSTRAVAVGDYGAIYTSTNGMNWSSSSSGTTEWLRGVTFGGGFFVAVGENGTILKAGMNVSSWSKPSSGTSEHLNRVRYLGNSSSGSFYAVGNSGTLLKSADGTNWSVLDSGTTNDLNDVARNNNGLLVVGDQTMLLSDDDGGTWVDQTMLSSNAVPAWTYLSAHGKGNEWLVAGRSGFQVEGSSSTGTTIWNETPSSSSHAWIWDMTVQNGLRVAVGDLANIQTSLDGILWVSEAVPLPATNTVLLGVGGTTNLLVAVGNDGNVVVSQSGTVDLSITNDFGTTNITVDTYGVVWTNLPAFTDQSLQGIDAKEGLFLACGGSGQIWASPDGTNWLARPSGTANFLSGLAMGDDACVAVGANGTLVKGAADGSSWTVVSSGTADWIYRVRWLEDRFVAVGENGRIMSSPDGQNWTSRISGSTKWLTDVTYLDGQWYVSGYHGTLLTSSDLTTWESVYLPTGKSLFTTKSHDGQLLVSGVEGVILRNQIVSDTTPVEILDYSYSSITDTNGAESIYEIVLFGGQPDQFFTFNSSTNLTDGSWTNLNGTLELYDASGALFAIRTRDATNAPLVEYYKTELVP